MADVYVLDEAAFEQQSHLLEGADAPPVRSSRRIPNGHAHSRAKPSSRRQSPSSSSSTHTACSCLTSPFFQLIVKQAVENALEEVRARDDRNTSRLLARASAISVAVVSAWALVKFVQLLH